MTSAESISLTSLVLALGSLASPASWSQDFSGNEAQIEEVIVSAQRRDESLKDVPIAVSVLGSADLANRGIDDASDLGLVVPNARVHTFAGALSFYVRGVGMGASLAAGSDAGMAFHENGVYIARPRAQVAALFDVERIEVLRGPQGTLYGRNATAGVVNVITKAPTENLSIEASIKAGNYDSIDAEGAVSGPLVVDRVKARLSGLVRRHDGLGTNIITGSDVDDEDAKAARITVDFALSQSVNLVLLGEYYTRDDRSGGFHLFGPAKPGVPLAGPTRFGGTLAVDPRDLSSEFDARYELDTSGFTATLDWEVNDTVGFKSISAYREFDLVRNADLDHTEVPLVALLQSDGGDQLSQELQALWTGSRLSGVAGVYYLKENIDTRLSVPLELLIPVPGARVRQDGTGSVETVGAFGNVDFQVTERLKLSTGIRYSYEAREHDSIAGAGVLFQQVTAQKHWDALTPKLTLSYELSDDVTAYVSAGKGFRSGAFGVGTTNPAVNPETVLAYETGVKATLADRRVQANVAAFYYDYTDLQVSKVVGTTPQLENAADATIWGVEAEIAARPWRGAMLQLNAGYLDATFDSYVSADPVFLEQGVTDHDGNRLPFAPKYTASLAASQEFPLGSWGAMTLLAAATRTDKVYFTAFNHDPVSQDAFIDLRARLAFSPQGSNWTFALWGENLGDETARAGGDVGPGFAGFPARGALNEPRRYGVEIDFRF